MERSIAPRVAAAMVALVHATALGQVCIAPEVARELDRCDDIRQASSIARPRAAPVTRQTQTAARTTAAGPQLAVPADVLDPRQRRDVGLLGRGIEILERLARNTPATDPRHADVLWRLANAYGELAYARERELRSLDEPLHQARARGESQVISRITNRARELTAQVRAARESSVRTWLALVDAHPQFRSIDEALFALALELTSLGRRDAARQAYHRLLRDAPQSRFVPHAYLAFAEHHLDARELDLAASFYERVLAIPPEHNPVYGLALYKLAWVRFNQERFRDSLDGFVRVIEHARASPGAPQSSSLLREARREIVLPYARVGRPGQAYAFFRRVAEGDAEALSMLESLAAHYFDAGRWPETVQVHHDLMARAPGSPHLCAWQARVLDATIASRPKADQVREVERLLAIRRERAGQGDAVARACDDEAATSVLLLATAWHREAVGTGDQPGTNDRRTMELAARLYERLRADFEDLSTISFARIDARDRPTGQGLAVYHAELLYELERWNECARAFDDAARMGARVGARSELAQDAAYGAVLCYDRVLAAAPPPSRAPNDRSQRSLAAEAERMLSAFRRFACLAPEHDELPVAQFRRALILFEHGRYDEASVLFRRVALDHPDAPVAEHAANLHLESLNVLAGAGRTGCVQALASDLSPVESRLCASEGARAAHPDVCGRIDPLRCEVGALAAQELHQQGHFPEAARAYLALVSPPRTCPQADRYLFNAAMAFEAARLLGRAIRVRQALLERFPESALAAPTRWLLAQAYHALAFYEPAAESYERFASTHPALDGTRCDPPSVCPNAPAALEHAVVMRAGLGQQDQALEDARQFSRRYAREHARESVRIAFAVAALHQRAERWGSLRSHLQELLRAHSEALTIDEVSRAEVGIARAWIREGRRDQAQRWLRSVIDRWTQGGDRALREAFPDPDERDARSVLARDAVAEALFELAEERRVAFDAIALAPLSGRASLARVNRWAGESFRPWLERKHAALASATEIYDRIAALSIPAWSIAAAARIGEMHQSIVDRAREMPVPAEIERDPELYEVYMVGLEGALGPIEDTAADRFAYCLSVATRARWFNDHSRRCEETLNRIDPARYPVQSELRGAATYVPATPATLGPPASLDSGDES